MSAHVLLDLLIDLGKRDKMRGLPSTLSLFRNKFNKFNNTRARCVRIFLIYSQSYWGGWDICTPDPKFVIIE